MTQTDRDSAILQELLAAAAAVRRAGDTRRAKRMLMSATVAVPAEAVGYVNLLGMAMTGEPGPADSGTRAMLERLRTLTGVDGRIARNLAVVATHMREPDLAAWYLRRTLLLEPGDATAWRLFVGHDGARRDACRTAVLLNPDNVELVRASVAWAAADKDWAAVLALLDLARTDLDASADTLIIECQTDALMATGQLEAAIGPVARRAAELPSNARLWFRLGVLLRSNDEVDASRRALRRACVLAPDYVDGMSALGRTELQVSHGEDALRWIDRALLTQPETHGPLKKNRAAALVSLRRGDAARPVLQEILVMEPGDSRACLNLATGEMYRLDFDAAERWVRRTLRLMPDSTDALYNGALVARHSGDYDTSIRRFDAAIRLAPGNATYRFNRATLQMQDGDTAIGCAEYRARHEVPEFSTPRRLHTETWLPLPIWDFSPAPDKRLAVWGEQGIGDEIWFGQFLDAVRDRVGSVVLEVSAKLVPTMKRTFPWAEVLARWAPGTDEAMARADLQLPVGDLVGLYPEKPPRSGYLSVNPGLVAAFRQRYEKAHPGRRRIGIAWRSVKLGAQLRSFEAPLEQWGPIFSLPDTEFFSLQYSPEPADFATVAERFGKRLFADPKVDAADDIGALAAQTTALDAVVSVASSSAIIAAGVGCRTYVPLRNLQDDFRYPHRGERSFWLPGVRFAWAPRPDRWDAALEDLAERIARDWAEG